MKRKLIPVLALLAFISVFFSGCKKDNGPDNYVKIEGTDYTLSKGYCLSYGHSSDFVGYEMQVFMSSSDVNYNGSVTGFGDMLWFSFASSSEQGLPDGTYTFSNTHPLPNSSFLGTSHWTIGWNTSQAKSGVIDGGEVTIVGFGNNVYELTVNCTDNYFENVTAHYKGTLIFVDKTGK